MDVTLIEKSLGRSDFSQLLSIEFGDEPFVIGAPHHTPGGVDRMPCDRVGDENVGYLALMLADHLKGQCIIASNYWLDSNKTCNDYIWYINSKKAKYFIEIHGHGGGANFDIEISCGSQDLTNKSESLAKYICEEINITKKSNLHNWDDIKISGKFSALRFQATKTLSLSYIQDHGGIPYHIEISPIFRRNEMNKVPEIGKKLIEVIAQSLIRISKEPNHQ